MENKYNMVKFSDRFERIISAILLVLIVCLIAVSRKILASGEEVIDPMTEFSIAGLVLALAISYYLVSKNIKELVEEEQKNAERKI